MAVILKNGGSMSLPIAIKRGNPIPLDTTAVWYAKADLEDYAKTGATAYVGQILTLIEGGQCEAYMISNEAGTLVKLAQTTASGDLAHDVAALQTQVNDLVSKVGAAAEGDTAATGLFKLIDDVKAIANKGVSDAAAAKSAADAAQADVDALEAVVGASDAAGLRKKVADNTAAIATLNGDDAGKSARAIASEEIAKVVDGAPESFDTLKEIAAWIAEHGTEAADLTAAVNKLQAILAGIGGEGEKATVVAYVTDAIAALNIGDYAKAADLTAAAARITALEKKPAAGITAEQIAAWDAKQDAGDYVDQSAYDTKIAALEKADSDNATAIANVKKTADAAIPKNVAAAEGTGTKITTDANGVVIGIANLTKSDIPTIDQSQVNGLPAALAGKQDNLTFNKTYDASTNKVATMEDIGDAKAAVVGSADDASSVDTIGGAKKYAEEKATAALNSAKSYADGILSGDAGLVKRVDALETKVDVAKVSTAISTAKTEAATDASTKDAALKSAILGQSEEGVDYVGTVKGAYEAAAAAQATANSKTTLEAVKALDYATKAEAEAFADGKDAAIAEAKKAGTDAASALTTYQTSNDKRVKAIEDKEAGWDAKQNAITDGSATIASLANGIVTIKAGVAQKSGAVAQGDGADIVLAKVAKTGAAADISIADADGKLSSTTVEAALAELAGKVTNSAVKCDATAATPDGVAKRYVFSQNNETIATIDIPKDMVVSSGAVVTNPEGQAAGTYLVLTLANATNDKVYINVGDLIEYVTAGSDPADAIQIAVSADHKVSASILDGSIALEKLASAVQTKINQAHSHTNKAVLDGIDATKVSNWDAAATAKHSHANKTVLDGITAAQVEKWDAANDAIEGAVEGAVASLDYTDKAVAGQYVSEVSQADGVIAVKRVALPTATAAALGLVRPDGTSLEVANGVMSIKQVSVQKLYIPDGDTLVLNGGTSV